MYAVGFNENPVVGSRLMRSGVSLQAKALKVVSFLHFAKSNENFYQAKVSWELNDAFHNQQ
jgi:hypothetical protein